MADEEKALSQIQILQSPIGGWNKRDNPEVMGATDAIAFENVVSTYGHVKMRNGYTKVYDTEWGKPINTLASYDRDDKCYMIIITRDKDNDTHILVCEGEDEDGKQVVEEIKPFDGTSLVDDNFTTCQFRGRLYLSSMYGKDACYVFNGETLTKALFTSNRPDDIAIRLEDIHYMTVFKQRLFFIERNTTRIWYVVQSGGIQGPCEQFDVSMFTEHGGYLVSLAQWSKAGSDSNQSCLVAITSAGEMLVYSGSDPQGEDWTLASKTQMPEVVGIRNTASFMDDVAIMTKGGLFSVSSIAGTTNVNKRNALSDIIVGAIKSLEDSFERKGWQVIYSEEFHWLIINVPNKDDDFYQYVCNMENNTWSLFTGINSVCYCNFRYDMYFGGTDGILYQYNKGGSDSGKSIRAYIQGSYQTFNDPHKKKILELALYMFSAFRKRIYISILADFRPEGLNELHLIGADGARQIAVWNKSKWNTDYWSTYTDLDSLEIQKLTTPVKAESARRFSIGLEMDANDTMESDTAWISTDVRYETSEF